jgi:hypothetical protein
MLDPTPATTIMLISRMIDPAQVDAVIDDLGLSGVGENWFVGQVNGVPLAMNVALTDVAVTFLFHARHPSKNIPVETPPIPPEFSLAAMADENKAEISLTPTSAWLTLSDQESAPSVLQVRQALKEFSTIVKDQGIDLQKHLCTTCGIQSVERPTFDDGRLQLLCDPCRQAAELKFKSESTFKAGQLPFLLIPGALCSVIGAIIWAGLWYAFHWFLQQQSSDRVYMPIAVLGLLSCGAGCLVPQPLLFYVPKVRNRGIHFGSWFAVFCTAAALILGEFLYAAALFIEAFKFVPPLTALPRLWPVVLSNVTDIRIVGAGAALVIAYTQSRSRKPLT